MLQHNDYPTYKIKLNRKVVFFGDKKKIFNRNSSIETIDNKDGTFSLVLSNLSKICDIVEYVFEFNTSIVIKGTIKINENKKVLILSSNVFGEFTDCFVILKNKNYSERFKIDNVVVTNKEYNIVILNATHPVLLFALYAKQFTKEGEIPTFLLIERYESINWNNLPYKMQKFPFLQNEKDYRECFFANIKKICYYVRVLYKINKNSKFHFFITDNYFDLFFNLVIQNDINSKNYSLNLLSDGDFTTTSLNKDFGINLKHSKQNIEYKINEIKKEYKLMCDYYKEKTDYIFSNPNYKFNDLSIIRAKFQYLSTYAFPLWIFSILFSIQSENFKYYSNIIDENDLVDLKNISPSFYNLLKTKIIQNNIKITLDSYSKKEFEYFDSFFIKPEHEIPTNSYIILDKRRLLVSNDYIEMKRIIKYLNRKFGNDHIYYYKGHPDTPKKYANQLSVKFNNLLILDNALPIELYLIKKENIKIISYPSTSLKNLMKFNVEFLALLSTKDKKSILYSPDKKNFQFIIRKDYNNLIVRIKRKLIKNKLVLSIFNRYKQHRKNIN